MSNFNNIGFNVLKSNCAKAYPSKEQKINQRKLIKKTYSIV